MIDLDFSGERQSSQELIEELSTPAPEGEYLLMIADAEVKPNKDTNKYASLKITFNIVDLEKKKCWKWIYLDMSNEIQKAVMREFLEAVYNEELTNVSLDPKDLIGRQVIGQLEIEPRNDDPNKFQNAVNIFYPAP